MRAWLSGGFRSGTGILQTYADSCRSCRRLRSFDVACEDQKIAAFGSSYTVMRSSQAGSASTA
ncbi:hypothetical protein CXF97_02365 [Pseudomonas sp. Choline-02u-1]|nr:hypothetical protein CXF97_02365 [Pseudomonas sp. Choline-02u-1]